MDLMITATDNAPDCSTYLTVPTMPPKGAVIVIHEVWGLDDHIRDVADRLAAEGYIALAPNLLDEQDIARQAGSLQTDLFDPAKRNQAQPRLRELMAPLHDDAFVKQTIARLKGCFTYLQERSDVAGRVAVIGFCFGGTYAYQLAAEEPLLSAAVAFYGHAPLSSGKLAWISCPVLAFYGERDERLIEQLPAVEEAMHEAGVGFEHRVYQDAGHAFFNDSNPLAYNEAAATDAWHRTLEFLDRQLRFTKPL